MEENGYGEYHNQNQRHGSPIAPKGSTILEAARLAHIGNSDSVLLKEINEIGACPYL